MRRCDRNKLGTMQVDFVDTARFWSKTKVILTNSAEKSCWEWQGRTHKGYGQFMLNGVCRYAPRVAWAIAFGQDPGDKAVLHHCDNPACVNPHHLFLGNAKDNTDDCRAKGRFHRGERTGGSVLKETDVLTIRSLYIKGVFGPARIAKKLNLSQSAVFGVIHGGNWSWLKEKTA